MQNIRFCAFVVVLSLGGSSAFAEESVSRNQVLAESAGASVLGLAAAGTAYRSVQNEVQIRRTKNIRLGKIADGEMIGAEGALLRKLRARRGKLGLALAALGGAAGYLTVKAVKDAAVVETKNFRVKTLPPFATEYVPARQRTEIRVFSAN